MKFGLEANDLLSTAMAAAPLAAMCVGTSMGCSEVTTFGDGEGALWVKNSKFKPTKQHF